MDWILLIIYSVITTVYIPLFIIIILRLKTNYPKIYEKVRVKFYSLFSIFMIFLYARLYLYIDLKNLKLLNDEKTMFTVIPFYVTEIIMSLFLSYVLFSVEKMENTTSHNKTFTVRIINDMMVENYQLSYDDVGV